MLEVFLDSDLDSDFGAGLSLGVVLLELVALAVDVAVEGVLVSLSLGGGELGLWYKSLYQPAPFKMKPLPVEICFSAVFFLHFGHFVRSSSLILCSTSQAWRQLLQR